MKQSSPSTSAAQRLAHARLLEAFGQDFVGNPGYMLAMPHVTKALQAGRLVVMRSRDGMPMIEVY